MTELPSLSKELDKYLKIDIVPGEATDPKGHYYVSMMLDEKEYANTPPGDLWDFHIAPALRNLAKHLNEKHRKVCVRQFALPPEKTKGVAGGFISADGRVPLRLLILYRPPDKANNVGRYLITIDTMLQEVAE